MKKIMLFCLMFIPYNILAYENDKFSIDVPEDMKEVIADNDYYKWSASNEEEIPNISVVQGKNSQHNINLFDDEDILAYEKYVESELNKELEEYDIVIDVYDSKILEINNKKSLVYKTKWDTYESYGYDTYQIAYVYTTKNYLTTLTFTAKSEEEINNETYSEIAKSFVINDENIVTENNNLLYIIGFAIVGGVIGLILSLIFSKKGDKK